MTDAIQDVTVPDSREAYEDLVILPDEGFDADIESDGYDFAHRSGIEVDFRTGDVCFWESPLVYLNSQTFDEYHGHVTRWTFSGPIAAEEMMAIAAEVREDLGRLVASYRSEWDGNNHKARFDSDELDPYSDADEIRQRIEETVESLSGDASEAFIELAGEACLQKLSEAVVRYLPKGVTAVETDSYGIWMDFLLTHTGSGESTSVTLNTTGQDSDWEEDLDCAVADLLDAAAEEESAMEDS